MVQPLDPIRWRYLPPLEMGFMFGEASSDEMYVTVGAASAGFTNHFRFDATYMEICKERMRYMAGGQASPIDLRQTLYRPPTIQVHNLDAGTADTALRTSQPVVEYCLFELAYLKHLPVGLADEWPARRRLEDDSFKFGVPFEGNRLPLPPAEFNTDVIQFYQLGVSSRVPVLQFWAFYQVMEHFFIGASDDDLHDKLSGRLKDPRFRPTPSQLDRVIQDVMDHLAEADEVYMLQRVLEKYVDTEMLIAFIEAYEQYLDDDLYTRRRRVFGEDVQVRLSRDGVMENVARTVLAIRRALVFSSDRFSRTARSISFEQLTEMIRPEIPLMRFLAERVIIGSAE
ncbi:MAG: hypothetical protein ACOCX5_00055 [Chloroflexota bacterium]